MKQIDAFCPTDNQNVGRSGDRVRHLLVTDQDLDICAIRLASNDGHLGQHFLLRIRLQLFFLPLVCLRTGHWELFGAIRVHQELVEKPCPKSGMHMHTAEPSFLQPMLASLVYGELGH